MHPYVHGLHPKIAESVAMQDPKTLDDAMRMTLTADAIIHHAVRVNPHRRVFNDTNILPMELGALDHPHAMACRSWAGQATKS